MKHKKNDNPQIKMDFSDLNFDWEDEDLKDEPKSKKKSAEPKKQHSSQKPSKGVKRRFEDDYDDAEIEGNEEPIMTFDEIPPRTPAAGAAKTASVAKAAVEKEEAVEEVAESIEEAVEETVENSANEEVAETVENSVNDATETAEESVAEKAEESVEESASENESASAEETAETGENAENADESAENAGDKAVGENASEEKADGQEGTEDGEKKVPENNDGEDKPKPKKKKKKKEEEEEERPLWKEIVELLIYLVVVFIVSYLIVLFVGQRTIVEGSSMNPTLVDGDNLIVDKMTYRFSDPQRFDVIVFPYQHAKHTFYIKRIIGLPGETVRIDQEGTIYINGNVLNESYGNEVILNPGRAYEEIVLGPDEYFVMGDNRNNSSDSRDIMVGNVHRKDFVGKAWLRIYPFNKFGLVKHAADEAE